MSKKNETTDTQQSQEGVADNVAGNQLPYIEDLLKKGTTILSAKTRNDLAEMVKSIPSNVKYGAGAVGFSPQNNTYSLRVDLIND